MRKRSHVTAVERIREVVEIRPDGTAAVIVDDHIRRADCQYATVTREVIHAMPVEKFLEMAPVVE